MIAELLASDAAQMASAEEHVPLQTPVGNSSSLSALSVTLPGCHSQGQEAATASWPCTANSRCVVTTASA